MKTKKAVEGLFGLFGSLAAFYDCFVPSELSSFKNIRFLIAVEWYDSCIWEDMRELSSTCPTK